MSWKNPEEDPLDKLSNAILRKPKCDHCPYRPKNFTDYVEHLKKEHPDGGSTASGRISAEVAFLGLVVVSVVGLMASLAWVGL